MGRRKSKKAASIIIKLILEKYDLTASELEELKILLYEFVQFMTTKAIKETLKDYNIII